ncbi:MAG TPA: phosphoribosylanthranilate isomerase [Granulicella sp.]|jgi:phosphoribosylanthranilate isomerase
MFIKICANTNLADAQLAIELGADAVGFVFARSKRQVTAEQVAEITPELPAEVEKVGVFATDDPFEVEHYVACSELTAAQLHGAFDQEMVQALSAESGGELKIIQTVAYELNPADRAASDKGFETTLRAVFAEPAVWAVLLDASKSGTSGGLGVAFDWEHVAEIVQRAYPSSGERPRVILAGGLRPENVAQAIKALQPWGVDVASGVEETPGKKDSEKVRAFIAAARAASRSR